MCPVFRKSVYIWCLLQRRMETILLLALNTKYLWKGLCLIVTQKEWQILINVELLQGAEQMFRYDILLSIVHAHIIGHIGQKIHKRIWYETNQIHCLSLCSDIRRQRFFNNLVKCCYRIKLIKHTFKQIIQITRVLKIRTSGEMTISYWIARLIKYCADIKWLDYVHVDHVWVNYFLFGVIFWRWATSFCWFLRFTCRRFDLGLWRLGNGIAQFRCLAYLVIWRRNQCLRSRRLVIYSLLVIQSCLTSSFCHNENMIK